MFGYCSVLSLIGVSAAFELTVLHVNDIHVRLEQTNKYSGHCKQQDKETDQCYGGVARLKHAVDSIKSTQDNVVFLNGGDFYQGNAWYTLFKWKVVAEFANVLNFTAMALGNHEFDDDITGFVPFLENKTFPIICANMDDDSVEPSLSGLIPPSTVVDFDGTKVGIIGYLTTDTPDISNPGQLTFTDEIEAIKDEAKVLKDAGVNILIALGHSGYEIDQEIARNVPDIDMVVGGHSHSFLFTGDQLPSVEKPVGPYPTIITQPKTGKKVPVVQAYAYTKYLGYMNLTFDDQGKLTHWAGSPLLLDFHIQQDQEVLQQLAPWQRKVDALGDEVIGETKVDLTHSRTMESNLGNFITDSMVYWYTARPSPPGHWSRTALALMNSGGIRGSFEMGNITTADMLTVLPFQNSIDLVTLSGQNILDTFELAAGKMKADGTSSAGGFLQVSGFHIAIDLRRAKGQRVTELLSRCNKCHSPTYSLVDPDTNYEVAMPSYLANGGDGNKFIKQNKVNQIQGPLDTDVFLEYLSKRSPVTQGIENRIRIITGGISTATTSSLASANTIFLTSIISSLFYYTIFIYQV